MDKARKISKDYADQHTCYANDPSLQYLYTRKAVEFGYRQAEKDLALTNADVYDIWRIYNEVCAEGEIFGFDETSQEVLKRFNKERKEK